MNRLIRRSEWTVPQPVMLPWRPCKSHVTEVRTLMYDVIPKNLLGS
jgi:hypothetical protein